MKNLLIGLAFIFFIPAFVSAGELPVVVELFTSEGCAACPPADSFLAKIADAPHTLALSYHVDYWDNQGWKDTFSLPESTERQKKYSKALGTPMYTPQIIMQGEIDTADTNALQAAKDRKKTKIESWIPAKLTILHDKLYIDIKEAKNTDAEITLIFYKKYAETAILRGENAGRKLAHRNSVTEIRDLGAWNGEAKYLIEPAKNTDGVAVLIQKPNNGKIIGGGWL